MFGEMKNIFENYFFYIVVFFFLYVISSGDVVGIFIGERIGECIWLGSKVNIYDVFIVKIDFLLINFLKWIYFNENIIVEECFYGIFCYWDVFKYGVIIGKISGLIE